MSIYKNVHAVKFDVPSSSDCSNMQDFLNKESLHPRDIICVKSLKRYDDLQTVIIFYLKNSSDSVVKAIGPSGDQGTTGDEGPKGEHGINGRVFTGAVCVYFYEKHNGIVDITKEPEYISCESMDSSLVFPDGYEVENWDSGNSYESDSWYVFCNVVPCDPNAPFNSCCPPCDPEL